MINFRLFATPVRIQPFFLLIAGFLGWSWAQGSEDVGVRLGIGMVVVFVGVLAHEFGHAFAGRAFGLTPQIELHGMGGVTSWRAGRRLSPGQSIFVSFAGPLVGIVIGTVALLLAGFFGVGEESTFGFTLAIVAWVNLGWGVLNLIPMMPLDGGNIMASFFELFAKGKGRVFARYVSLGISALVLALAVYAQQIFAAVVVGWLALNNWRGLQAEKQIGDDGPLLAELRRAQAMINQGAIADGIALATRVRNEAKRPLVQGEATQVIALGHLVNDNPKGAEAAIVAMPPGREVEPGLLGAVRFELGDMAGALDPLEQALDKGGPFIQTRLATAYVETQEFERAADLL
ncbi:MAG: site-2 protease family protein, partial [Myxococcota bacterium]